MSSDVTEEVTRPGEEDERSALVWLVDVRTHGGPLDRRYAATIIETLAWFEARVPALTRAALPLPASAPRSPGEEGDEA